MLKNSTDPSDATSERPHDADPPNAVQMLAQLAVPAFALDVEGRVILWNKACERLTQMPAADVLGTGDHWRAFHEAAQPSLADLVLEGGDMGERPSSDDAMSAATDGVLSAARWCAMPHVGSEHFLAFDASLIRDADGRLIAAMQTIRDMTRHRRTETAFATLGMHDRLTGLPNRISFDRLAQIAWQAAGEQGAPLSVMMIDLDSLKLYNDAYGLAGGDACLKIVAETICRHLSRAEDVVARYGGEKFAVLLPDRSVGVAGEMAEQIRRAVVDLELPHSSSPVAPFVSVSVGVASGMTLDTHIEQLLADADAALLRAKREGRNRCSASRAGVALSVIDAFDDRPSTREALRRRRDLQRGA